MVQATNRAGLLRREARLFTLGLLLCVSSLSACGGAEPRALSPASGEVLYRGLFFGQGEVTEQVPELREMFEWQANLEPAQRAALTEFMDQVVAVIDRTQPGFFPEFAAAMQSGDHNRISRMTQRATGVTVAALAEIPSIADWRAQIGKNREVVQQELLRLHNEGRISEGELKAAHKQLALMAAADGELGGQVLANSSWSRGLALAVVVAVAAYVVYPTPLALAVVVVAAYAWAWTPVAADTEGHMQREVIIDAIATHLAIPEATAGGN
jgi:hypothetical protein